MTTPVIQRLEEVSRGYTIFEKDQVLTEAQLNRLADYLDDQERLTRVALLGVGIACGLRITLAGGKVTLTKGAGVTTDGDLIRVPADLTYTRFRAYDETAPVYAPFYDGAAMRKVFELTTEDVATAAPLGGFETQTGKKLTDMTAVLLMESFIKDGDLCTGGDCDNKGKDGINNIKLLLLKQGDVNLLRETLSTPDATARLLDPPVSADRIQLTEAITTPDQLTKAYLNACRNTRDRLKKALAKIFGASSTLLNDVFPADPASKWNTALEPPAAGSIQYHYDFLKDVAETYNTFRDVLFGDTAVCVPPLGAFPKHLLLGDVGAGTLSGDSNRTGYYPSPFVRGRRDVDYARFLARKIDTLITSFKIPDVNTGAAIAITPSRSEEWPLETRAIPSYYTVDKAAAWPIHRAWSYRLESRGMSAFNYSARAREFDAVPPALTPLAAQIGGYSFFRIEGHVGLAATAAVDQIQNAIKTSNLPFAVRAVHLGIERPKIVVKPPIRYGDLHRLHYLVRQDVSNQLADVVKHGDTLKTRVAEAIDMKVVADTSKRATAANGQAAIADAAGKAKGTLDMGYTAYRAAAPWQPQVMQTITQATELKSQLGEVAHTDFATPIDSLLTNNHILWADWLDRIIDTKNDTEDDKLLFLNFIKQHPAAEHFAGVARGGTFVLLYDNNGTVVADVTLPYWWPEVAEQPAPEPPLPLPPVKPPTIITKPVRVIPELDVFIDTRLTPKLNDFKIAQIDPIRTQAIDLQKSYVQAVNSSVDVLGRLTAPIGTIPTPPRGVVIADPGLDTRVRDLQAKTAQVDNLRQVLNDPALDAAKRTDIENQLKTADAQLGTAVTETVKFLATTKVETATDGAAATAIISESISKLNTTTATTVGKTALTDITAATTTAPTNKDTQVLLRNVLKTRGLG